MEEQLLELGFKKEDYPWSFSPKLSKSDGYFVRQFPYDGGKYVDHIEVAIIIDKALNKMEVLYCICVVGCCGRSSGVHDFSVERINKLIKVFYAECDELYKPARIWTTI